MEQIPQNEISETEIKEAFKRVDSNNDGVIDREQLVEAMKILGQDLNPKEVDDLTKHVPSKKSYEFQDFLDMVIIKMDENSEESIMEDFQTLDRHDEGFITEENFRRIMTTMGEPLSHEEFKQLMAFVKLDREGNFSYQELLANMAEKNPGIAFQKLS